MDINMIDTNSPLVGMSNTGDLLNLASPCGQQMCDVGTVLDPLNADHCQFSIQGAEGFCDDICICEDYAAFIRTMF
jgi:hypothetical protein